MFSNHEIIVDTPFGIICYSGILNESTLMTMPNGKMIPFYSLLSHTQGVALQYFTQPTAEAAKTSKGIEKGLSHDKLELIED